MRQTCSRCLDGRHVRCEDKLGCACSCNRSRASKPVAAGGVLKVDRPRVRRPSTPRPPRAPRPQRFVGLRTCADPSCFNLIEVGAVGKPRQFCGRRCHPCDPRAAGPVILRCEGDGCANLLLSGGRQGRPQRHCSRSCNLGRVKRNVRGGQNIKLGDLTRNQKRARRHRAALAALVEDREGAIAEIATDPTGATWSVEARRIFAAECDRVAAVMGAG